MPLTPKQFGEALLARREALGLTQIEAASRLGVTVRTLQRYEGGQSAPEHERRRTQLLDRIALASGPPVRRQRRPGRPSADADKHDMSEDIVAITGGGSAGAGDPRSNDGEAEQRVMISAFELYRVTGLIGPPLQDLRWLIVVGDSMEPALRAGERVYYLLTHTFSDAGMYVVELDGERIVKRVQRHGGGALSLIPVNTEYERERFQPILGADTPNTFRSDLTGLTCTLHVVGKVLFNLQPR